MTLHGIQAFVLGFSSLFCGQGDASLAIGSALPRASSLCDIRGNSRHLADFHQGPGLAVLFLSQKCPESSRVLPEVVKIERELRKKNVAFVAVYSSPLETADDIAGHAYDHSIPFPVLRDRGGALAQRLGVTRTPTAALLDQGGNLAYRGRLDSPDQTPGNTDALRARLDDLLNGRKIANPETEVSGSELAKTAPAKDKSVLTYCRDIAPIFQRRCEECHREGRIGPFTLLNYNDVTAHAETIREAVEDRRMPPWHADPRYSHFHNDRRMSPEEVSSIVAWIDAGMPKGDEADLPPKKNWVEGWEMGEPDVVLKVPSVTEVPADGVVPYRYLPVPTGFTEDKWVIAAEGKPGQPSVVHHIIIYILSPERVNPFDDDDGDMKVLTAWAPGDGPFLASPGTALRVPKDSTLLFEMHYTPNGRATTDQSMVGIRFASSPPERQVHANFFGNESISIPPHDPHHAEIRDYVFKQDARITAFLPHMHWRGKHFHYQAFYPDGRSDILLSVPRWDFNWQTSYWLAEPLKVPKGTRIRATCHWDNSKNNPSNPDPSKRVNWGLQTWDEMMVGWMYYVHEEPDADVTLPPVKRLSSFLLFRNLDRDKNGWVQGSEIPQSVDPIVQELGINRETGLDRLTFEFIYREIVSSLRPGASREGGEGRHDGD